MTIREKTRDELIEEIARLDTLLNELEDKYNCLYFEYYTEHDENIRLKAALRMVKEDLTLLQVIKD